MRKGNALLTSRETLSFGIRRCRCCARCSPPALTSHGIRPSTTSTVLYSGSGHRQDAAIINGTHAILDSDAAAATRAALAKVLGTRSVDAGGGWLIFALPPAELAVHPAERGGQAELYLLCDDVAATVATLQAEGVEVARPVSDQGWGC